MKTVALFVDAYRELNSKKLFWITMMLSGLVVLIFAAVGLNERGLVLLWFTLPMEGFNSETFPPALLYKLIFLNFGVKFWLTTIATILALITTAGMIPDFISGGSIELMLSKPVSRTRLYLTKFACGLIFVTLQVAVFAIASLLVIGIRGGAREFGILLAIPIVVLFYSYLFSMCMLIGLVTKSTLAALLLTGLIWGGLTVLHWTDAMMLNIRVNSEQRVQQMDERIETLEQELVTLKAAQNGDAPEENQPDADAEPKGSIDRITQVFKPGRSDGRMGATERASRIATAETEIENLTEQKQSTLKGVETLGLWHKGVYGVKTVLPKTGETLALLERNLVTLDDLGQILDSQNAREDPQLQAELEYRKRPLWWIIGTSLAFEAFILAIGAWIFSRRDF
ncbi:MAG: ABC transporter permease [Phycisphaerales bacterium JB050]